MPLIEIPDEIDDSLRELFHSFDSSSILTATARSERRTPLSRGRAIAWAGVIALALVVALISVRYVQSGAVARPTGPHPAKPSTSGACARNQLEAAVVFNQPGTELGAIRLTNTTKSACSLSGRPQIVVNDSIGHNLGLSETAYNRAPDLGAPKTPIVLSASGSSKEAVVELDWCGFQTHGGYIDIRFSGWTNALVVEDSSFAPPGFSPPACLDPSQKLLAVDVVRAFGSSGVVTTVPSVSVAVTPDVNLHAGEPVAVTVRGLAADAPLHVSECATIADFDASGGGCGVLQSFGFTDGSGDESITFDVQAEASATPGSTGGGVTCTDRCVIVASAGTGSNATSAYAPIVFQRPVVNQTTDCGFSQLAVTAVFGGVGLGHESVLLLFKNTSAMTCSLYGYPGVAGLNAQGVQITQAVRTLNGYMGGAGQSAPHVSLVPGDAASAVVEGTDVPVGNETSCPTYSSLLVTPPDATQSVAIHISLPGCSGLQVHPVVPRT
jgi:hypothetical protein